MAPPKKSLLDEFEAEQDLSAAFESETDLQPASPAPSKKPYSYEAEMRERAAKATPEMRALIEKGVADVKAAEKPSRFTRLMEKLGEPAAAALSGASVIAPEQIVRGVKTAFTPREEPESYDVQGGDLSGQVYEGPKEVVKEYEQLRGARQQLESEHPFASAGGALLAPGLGQAKVAGLAVKFGKPAVEFVAKNPKIAKALFQGGANAVEAFFSSYTRGASLEDSLSAAGLSGVLGGVAGTGRKGQAMAGAATAGAGGVDYYDQVAAIEASDMTPAEKELAKQRALDNLLVAGGSGALMAAQAGRSKVAETAAGRQAEAEGVVGKYLGDELVSEHRKQQVGGVEAQYQPKLAEARTAVETSRPERDIGTKQLESRIAGMEAGATAKRKGQLAPLEQELAKAKTELGLTKERIGGEAKELEARLGLEKATEKSTTEQDIIQRKADLKNLYAEKQNARVDQLIENAGSLGGIKQQAADLERQIADIRASGREPPATLAEKLADAQQARSQVEAQLASTLQKVDAGHKSDFINEASRLYLQDPKTAAETISKAMARGLVTKIEADALLKDWESRLEVSRERKRAEYAQKASNLDSQIASLEKQLAVEQRVAPMSAELGGLERAGAELETRRSQLALEGQKKAGADETLTDLEKQLAGQRAELQKRGRAEAASFREAQRGDYEKLARRVAELEGKKGWVAQRLEQEKARIQKAGESEKSKLYTQLKTTHDAMVAHENKLKGEYASALAAAKTANISPEEMKAGVDLFVNESSLFRGPITKSRQLAAVITGMPADYRSLLADAGSRARFNKLLADVMGRNDKLRVKFFDWLDPNKQGNLGKALNNLSKDPDAEEFRQMIKKELEGK